MRSRHRSRRAKRFLRAGLLASASVAVLAAAPPAFAVTLDFEGLPFTTITAPGDTTPDPASVLNDQYRAQGLVFGEPGQSAGVAVVRASLAPSSGLNTAGGLDSRGILPGGPSGALLGDIYFQFVVPGGSAPAATDQVSFTIGDAGGDLDQFQIRWYDVLGGLIGLRDDFEVSRFPVLLSDPGIHRVEIDFSGTAGYSLDDLEFAVPGGCLAPLAEAGPDQSVCAGSAVTLDGSATAPCSGSTTRYRWLEGAVEVCALSTLPTCQVRPGATTAYTLEVACDADPGCLGRDALAVVVIPDLVPPDLGNTLRAVRLGNLVALSWASHPLAATYALRRSDRKDPWPGVSYRTGLARETTSEADVDTPPPLLFYRVAGASCSGEEGL